MILLSKDTEALATRLADAHRVTAEEVIRQALEAHARATGLTPQVAPTREIAAMPVLDPRPIDEIIADINEL